MPENIKVENENLLIERELHHLNGMYMVNDGILPKNESHYRLGEPLAVWTYLQRKKLIVISGTKGEGKTCLLRQLQGEHPNQFTYWTVSDSDLFTETFDLGDRDVHGYDELLKYFHDTGKTFGIDEYTQILDDARERTEYRKFKDFVGLARSQGIPLALVIHHVPRILDRFIMDSEDIDYDQIYYPKPISLDELNYGSHHGPFHRRGDAPYSPSALKIDDNLGAEVLEITGNNPLLVNSLWTRLLGNLFSTDFDGHITSETLRNYWFGLSQAIRTDSYNISRVFDYARKRFNDDPKEFAYFTQILKAPRPDFSDVDIRLLIEWDRLHLIRKDNNGYLINGQIVRDQFI